MNKKNEKNKKDKKDYNRLDCNSSNSSYSSDSSIIKDAVQNGIFVIDESCIESLRFGFEPDLFNPSFTKVVLKHYGDDFYLYGINKDWDALVLVSDYNKTWRLL